MSATWSIADLLARHPWPAEWASEDRLEWLWHFDLPVAREQLWPIIADSSRLNRALGLVEMKFQPKEGKLVGSSRSGGRHHEWTEVPWSWVAGEWMESLRAYTAGYPRAIWAIYELVSEGAGTRLYIYFGVVPRGWVSKQILRYAFPTIEAAYAKVLPRIAEALAAQQAALAAAPATLVPGAETRLPSISERLVAEGCDRGLVEKLIDWIRTADDLDIYRIQIRERARAWSVDEDALLRVALHATRAGLFELSWDIVCPHCRGVTGENDHLGAIPTDGKCPACDIEFGTDRAEAVEITFHIHASIREVPRRYYCSAEPAQKSHIRVQLALPPGASTAVMPELGAGRYRTRVDNAKDYGYLDVAPGDATPELEWRAAAPPATVIARGRPKLALHNDARARTTFVIEQSQWSDLALRPGDLLSFQDFRDLYTEEYVGADVQLGIGEQTILFTDMVGSTAMYAQRGDPAAFVEVRRHFADVFRIIGEHRGAVVKTIGDAAMGAFRDPVQAVKAATAIQRAFPPGRTDLAARLRISLNTGPCIAVRLNTDIDYFGHTVNVAAKLQALAESWQIALAETTYRAPGVAAFLDEQKATLENCEYRSAAIPEGVRGKRWTVFTP